ncbi:Crp/Fnr family transcriptional regulator [Sulfuriflexus mobilis]|uniref:Crp/Fnr family transcriptional regulator n=1 Tax=Sulfuriflexus mobilis TaxID=1811807 RepID=UPI000F8497DD|nr:Crp/Fnr family transcriptional regulator [Sulfuriflexus mobilis]
MGNTLNWFTQTSDYLNKLSLSDRDDLLAIADQQYFSKSEFIFRAGTASEYVYILKTGQVKIYELSAQAKEVILWFCFPGEVFGLSEITRGARRAVYAQASTPSEVYLIKRVAFNTFLTQHPAASMSIIDLLSCRLRGLSEMLSNLTSDDVTSRIIKLLIRMSMLYGAQKQDMLCLNMHITHQEIADMIGASRQTVSSIIGRLKREGLLFMDHHTIHIDKASLSDNFKYIQP